MTLIYYIIIIGIFFLTTYLILKKFKVLEKENGSIPKEYKPMLNVLIFLFLVMVSAFIYLNFFADQHYNF